MRSWPARGTGSSDDAVAPQRVKFVRGNAEALQHFGGVFAEFGDVRRDFVSAQAGHFDGGTEHLDIVVIAHGAAADNMTRGDVVGEEERDEVVAFVSSGPFTDDRIELVNQFVAAPMVLVVGMRDEVLAGHQARELMPVCFGEAVNPDFAVGTWIGIAGAGSGMAITLAADLEAVLDEAEGAVDRGHTSIEHRNLDLAAAAGALAFEERGQDARGEMHPGAGIDEGGGDANSRAVGIAGHADDARGGLDGKIHRAELREAAVAAVALARGIDEAGGARGEVVVTETEAF